MNNLLLVNMSQARGTLFEYYRYLSNPLRNDVVTAIFNSPEMEAIKSNLPTGYSIEVGGSLEESQDASVQMGTSFLISFIVIVLIRQPANLS